MSFSRIYILGETSRLLPQLFDVEDVHVSARVHRTERISIEGVQTLASTTWSSFKKNTVDVLPHQCQGWRCELTIESQRIVKESRLQKDQHTVFVCFQHWVAQVVRFIDVHSAQRAQDCETHMWRCIVKDLTTVQCQKLARVEWRTVQQNC